MGKLVKIDKKTRDRCNEFAELRSKDAELYKKRGGFKKVDIVCGAMAEFASYHLLRKANFKVTEPDLRIYTTKQKSFDADLTDYNKFFSR